MQPERRWPRRRHCCWRRTGSVGTSRFLLPGCHRLSLPAATAGLSSASSSWCSWRAHQARLVRSGRAHAGPPRTREPALVRSLNSLELLERPYNMALASFRGVIKDKTETTSQHTVHESSPTLLISGAAGASGTSGGVYPHVPCPAGANGAHPLTTLTNRLPRAPTG